jgi:hypothetical protein
MQKLVNNFYSDQNTRIIPQGVYQKEEKYKRLHNKRDGTIER